MVSLFVLVELVTSNVMEPWLYGASTGLSTVAILIAAVFWTWLWGPAGLMVATPLTVCLAVIGKYVEPLRFFHVLLSDEDALPPSVGFYQRLLAGDRTDAERIVNRTSEKAVDMSLADSVYLPALRMARRDRKDERLSTERENRLCDEMLAIAVPAARPSETPEPSAVPIQVLAYPSHHRFDEITLHMLADELRKKSIRTTVLSTRTIAADVELTIARDRPAVLVISIMPPGGLPQTRYLCRRFRKRFPDLPICVGYWGKARDFDRLLVRLRDVGATYVLTSIQQMQAQVTALLKAATIASAVPIAS